MIKVNVELSDDTLIQLRSALNGFMGNNASKIIPRTKTAFDMASQLIQKSWQNWALGGSLAGVESIKNPNTRLASSIKIRGISDFDVSIETDSRYMERIQNGVPGFDMKEKYPYGAKSRVSKKGVPYLIIPFRWGTPNKDGSARSHFGNVIPLEVYKILQSKKFRKSSTTGNTHIEQNAKGQDVQRAEYDWGDRIIDSELGNASGMVKMQANPKSTYFTFRVISANSPSDSWIKKDIPPNNVVEAVERNTRSDVETLLQEGLEQDLEV